MKKKLKSSAIPWDDFRREYLKDPANARSTIDVAVREFENDNDIEALLDTLRLVAQAQGGLAKLARKASVSRQALHEALSTEGNPRIRTFQNVIGSLGLRMCLRPIKSRARLARAA